ncbi:citrate synthase, glyoxysomal isoform X1 [Daucus carota subsp. sativus]|uniref:citrate synthase, glyoxysomal isoform X1 n=1 Tax=Daucus carota subsp. sativus TaxID=79200 RepID=UPI00308331CA
MSGFSHRMYKKYDPGAKLIKKLAEEVFSIVGRVPLIEVALALEKAALSDEYFVKWKLYPNVDLYSGCIEFFPVLFAIPRMAGYLSHWKESLNDPCTTIMRHAQVYTGVWLRPYIPQRERMVATETDKLSQISVSNATRRRLAAPEMYLPTILSMKMVFRCSMYFRSVCHLCCIIFRRWFERKGYNHLIKSWRQL